MKQRDVQIEGAKADLTKRLQKLTELQLKTRQIKESKNKRGKIMKEVKQKEKGRWKEFMKQQQQALKKEILQKKKITEKQSPKTSD